MSHTLTLVIAYATICALWWGLSCVVPLWRQVERPTFSRPWTEVGLALAAAIAVLILGQLWSRGIRLSASGAWQTVAESMNQLLIFCPIILLPMIRKQGLASAWIQRSRLWARLAIGVGLAMVALLVFSVLEGRALSYWDTIKSGIPPVECTSRGPSAVRGSCDCCTLRAASGGATPALGDFARRGTLCRRSFASLARKRSFGR
jgi:hypothetical protein